MKRLLLVLIVLASVSVAAMAEGAPRGGAFGVQTSLGVATSPVLATSSLGVKYMITDVLGVRAEVGITNLSANGSSTTGYEFGGGLEYHFGGKGGVSPYVGAQLGYAGGSLPGGATADSIFALKGVFGGEYFFSNNFSLAGELQLGFSSANTAGVTSTSFFTAGASTLLATWYIN